MSTCSGSEGLACPKCHYCTECGDCACPPEPALDARSRYFLLHEQLCNEARELSKKKNSDYASGEDPYRNFRTFGSLGFLVRMSDKFSRLRTFVEKGEFEVKDETVKDTLIDIINYACLLHAYWEEGNK